MTANPPQNIAAAEIPEPMPMEKFGFFLVQFLLVALFSRFLETHLASLHLPMIAEILALAVVLTSGGVMRVTRSKASIWLVMTTVWMIACIPTAFWRAGSIDQFRHHWMLSVGIFYLTTSLVVTMEQCRKAMFAIGIGVALSTMGAVSRADDRLGTAGGTFGNSNYMAIAFLIGLPCLWLLMADSRASKLRKLVVFCFSAVVAVDVLKTGSREALVAIAIVGFSVFRRVSITGKMKMVVAAMAMAVLFFALVPREVKLRYLTMFSHSITAESQEEAEMLTSAAGSSNDRWNLVQVALKMTLHHPIFGVGAGNFAPYNVHTASDAGRNSNWNGTHDTYLQFFAEEGIPGGVFFILAVVTAYRSVSKLNRRARKLVSVAGRDFANTVFAWQCSLLSFIVLMFFAHIGYEYTPMIMLGISESLSWAGGIEIKRLEELDRGIVQVSPFLPQRQPAPTIPTDAVPAGSPARAFRGFQNTPPFTGLPQTEARN